MYFGNSSAEEVAKVVFGEGSVFVGKNHDALVAIVVCMPLSSNVENTCEYKILKKLTNVPLLHYHTSLGNKTLTEIEGDMLWPLLGVDIFLDV